MSRTDPRDRIELFTERMRTLCDEADLPQFDEAHFDERQATLAFIWHTPPFCLAAPLLTASIYGLTAANLHASWISKHGGDWRARLARGAIRPRDERAA